VFLEGGGGLLTEGQVFEDEVAPGAQTLRLDYPESCSLEEP
jgi:hypothetical protein